MKIIHLFTKRPDGREDWQWMTWRWEDQYQDLYNQLRTFRRGPVADMDIGQQSWGQVQVQPFTITTTSATIDNWFIDTNAQTSSATNLYDTSTNWKEVLKQALIKKRTKP